MSPSSRFPDLFRAVPGGAQPPQADLSPTSCEAARGAKETVKTAPNGPAAGVRARIGRFDDLF